MNKFIKSILFFITINTTFIFLCFVLIDGEKYINSYDYALIDKKKLLEQPSDKKRIILIGGSGTSFGFYSPLVDQKLNVKTINTAIYAGYGLKFCIDFAKPYIRKNDIIILIPEYSQYFNDDFYGASAGLILPVDAMPENLNLLNFKQISNQVTDIPKTAFGKIKSVVKYNTINGFSDDMKPYLRTSFNKNGDAVGHWGLKPSKIKMDSMVGEYNPEVIKYIQEFNQFTNDKKANLYISYPSFCKTAFKKNTAKINLIKGELKKSNLKIVGNPTEFSFDEKFYFDSDYHLIKEGQIKRTELMINHLNSILSIKKVR